MAEIHGWMMLADLGANVMFARGGWDGVVLDMQHGLFDEAAVVRTLQALTAPSPKRLVRVAANEPSLICKALDAGADGIIAPLVGSAEEARRIASACRYPPHGTRSYGPLLAPLRSAPGRYLDDAAQVEVWAMVETRAGLEAADAIAAVDGITGLFVGPTDLGLSLGLPPVGDREEADMLRTFERIIEAARAAGKPAGIFCTFPAYAARMIALGFSMVTAATDARVLADGAVEAVRIARGSPRPD